MDSEPDISNTTSFPYTQDFEQAVTSANKHGLQLYVRRRVVTRTGQRVTSMSLDTLTSVLIRIFTALPSAQETEPDLSLMAAAIALGGQGSADDTGSARAALLLATFGHLVSTTAADGTTLDGLQRTGDFIVLPFFPPSQMPTGAKGEKAGPMFGGRRSLVGELPFESELGT